MTLTQIELVRSTWASVVPIQATAADLFHGKLFELDPGLRPLFREDIRRQGGKLMRMIDATVRGLDDPHALAPAIRDLGRRHVAYGVRDGDYGTVEAALLWTLEQCLGEAFAADVRQAWAEVCAVLAATMRSA